MMNRQSHPVRLARIVLTLLALTAPARAGSTQESIQPLAPGEKAFGLTLSEWATAWYQWDWSLPVSGHPDTDKTGVRAGVAQRMPVWFLPSAFLGNSFTRTIIVPAGYGILLTGPTALSHNIPGKAKDGVLTANLQAYVKQFLDKLKALEASVNGVPIPDVQRFRVRTPVFSLVLPPGNWFDFPVVAGQDHRRVAIGEGFFFLLPSLPVGKHVIQVRVEGVDPDSKRSFNDLSVYNLIIQEPNAPLP
jgi:hypothetical protein